MRVDNSTGKGTSGMDKFSSKVYRVHMELGGKLLNSLRIESQFLERLQSVSVVDGAAHTQKDHVKSNRGGSLENVAKVFALFLCGVQLVLRSGVLTVLDLDKVKVKVTSLYMPQRASQRKLGKSLQPNVCKQRGGDYDKKEKETEKGLGWRGKGESRMARKT